MTLAIAGVVALAAAVSTHETLPTAAPPGPWTGEWKVVRVESDTGRRLPGGPLTFVQRGRLVCGTWSWNRFADGRYGLSRGTLSRLGMSATGRDAKARVRWTIKLRPEVIDRFEGPFSEVDPTTGGAVEGTMYGTRIGPPRRRPTC
jgi:hypothetical protein